MNKQTEALEQPAQGLMYADVIHKGLSGACNPKITEQPVQEPLTRAQQVIRANNSAQEHCVNLKMDKCEHKNICEHCTHPAPSWQGLSDDEIYKQIEKASIPQYQGMDVTATNLITFARAIEQALKDKNHEQTD